LSDPITCPQPTPHPLTPLQPTTHTTHTDPYTHPGVREAPWVFEIKFEIITVSRRQISRKSFSRFEKSVFEINDFSGLVSSISSFSDLFGNFLKKILQGEKKQLKLF
jgi:hypothetical protein